MCSFLCFHSFISASPKPTENVCLGSIGCRKGIRRPWTHSAAHRRCWSPCASFWAKSAQAGHQWGPLSSQRTTVGPSIAATTIMRTKFLTLFGQEMYSGWNSHWQGRVLFQEAVNRTIMQLKWCYLFHLKTLLLLIDYLSWKECSKFYASRFAWIIRVFQ